MFIVSFIFLRNGKVSALPIVQISFPSNTVYWLSHSRWSRRIASPPSSHLLFQLSLILSCASHKLLLTLTTPSPPRALAELLDFVHITLSFTSKHISFRGGFRIFQNLEGREGIASTLALQNQWCMPTKCCNLRQLIETLLKTVK